MTAATSQARCSSAASTRYHLLMKPAVSGTADQAESGDDERAEGPGHLPAQPLQVVSRRRADPVDQCAHGHEQGPLHQGVVEQMQMAGGEAGCRAVADTQDHVADLSDARIGQQALCVVLIDCRHRGDEHTGHAQHQEDLRQRSVIAKAVGETR